MKGVSQWLATVRAGALSGCLALGLALGTSPMAWAQEGLLTVATGGVTGVYYAAGGALCRLVNKDRARHNLRCTIESTGGSVFNVSALRTGDFEIGVLQSDVAYNAYHGEGQFEAPFTEMRSLFSIHPEPLTVLVSQDSGVQSFADLEGKRFNIGNPGSGSRASIDLLLNAMGLDTSFFGQATEYRPDEHGQALCDNKIDGLFYGVGHPSTNIQEPTTTCGAQLVPLEGEAVDTLVADLPYYAKTVIPGDTYPDNPDDIATYGPLATFVTTSAVPNETVYQLVKAVFENLADFKRMHPALAHLNPEEMVSAGLTAPLHPGAERYFKEIGLL
ncbi:MAG TPA: TAXI family TRAP transporter solute-binding subunit [Paenalcaligenes sp.]|nr:TAXI family TRAP transporter solute-binding subunit [Paenalcaligenes sp.]